MTCQGPKEGACPTFEQSKYGGGSGTKERKSDEMGWGVGSDAGSLVLTVRDIIGFNPGLAVTGKLHEDTHSVTSCFH